MLRLRNLQLISKLEGQTSIQLLFGLDLTLPVPGIALGW